MKFSSLLTQRLLLICIPHFSSEKYDFIESVNEIWVSNFFYIQAFNFLSHFIRFRISTLTKQKINEFISIYFWQPDKNLSLVTSEGKYNKNYGYD